MVSEWFSGLPESLLAPLRELSGPVTRLRKGCDEATKLARGGDAYTMYSAVIMDVQAQMGADDPEQAIRAARGLVNGTRKYVTPLKNQL